MSIALFLKNNLRNIPPNIGQYINKFPFSLRPGIGTIYKKRKKEISQIGRGDKRAFVFERVQNLVNYAYSNVFFYKDYYDSCGYNPQMLRTFEDILDIPIINKSILKKYDINQRSSKCKSKYLVNTGGSSGTPFSLYIEPTSMGHEWAHMHTIWEKVGYKPSELKIVFGGRSDVKNLIEYDVIRNHFAIDIYADYKLICNELKTLTKKYSIKYLHGYPSSIYDFAIFCEKFDPELQNILRKSLKGAMLGSEYPHKLYREKIESVFGIKTISWYGHTERAILAYEDNIKFQYKPFLTYGYSESIRNVQMENELIATSYYNFASPLIRYNTEDIIDEPIVVNGILESFQILKGRSGEFVKDLSNKDVNLTALIFGRHHELFNWSNFIQIRQINVGEIEINYVADNVSEIEASQMFDMKNLNFKVSFRKQKEPIKTLSGKINLLIK